MTKAREIYKCDICGNIVEVVHNSAGVLVCCGKPMILKTENTQDAAVEKHVPVVEKIEGGIRVVVGAVEHPMTEEHYIEFIEVHTENKVYRKFLKSGERPVAEFMLEEEVLFVREYCNLHGLWKA